MRKTLIVDREIAFIVSDYVRPSEYMSNYTAISLRVFMQTVTNIFKNVQITHKQKINW